ncbi:RasGEF, variant 3 [Schistosoma haematobium]|uniref:RasGEF, variant 3 n=1 Tax=Schistosoma haematobium TaxID=6185 RepID=A0A922S4H4_SCHHA|nr:RasGEF, variant 3 [Schistosoma haematobium]KAH9592835.1 RasGEF, variant 3 [Schistosoma haematobium]
MSIISALQVECIYRLRHTWTGLGNKDRAAYRRLEELFSQNDNCRRQREHMNSISLPGIPYLGLYLSDLTYTNVAQPRINGKPTAVWFTKINSIIDKIAYFQQSEYCELIL